MTRTRIEWPINKIVGDFSTNDKCHEVAKGCDCVRHNVAYFTFRQVFNDHRNTSSVKGSPIMITLL